jgi:uncharacterized protein (TIGR03435 family)
MTQLRSPVMQAYQIESDTQLSGVPAWGKSAQYQIEAKTDPAAGADQMRLMLRSLLEKRFKLKLRHESRDVDAYALVVAKSGHKLQQAKDESGNPIVAIPPREQNPENMKAAMAKLQSGQKMGPVPGTYNYFVKGNGPLEFEGIALQLSQLTKFLRQTVGRQVFDKTGLVGFYDIKLQYAPEPGKSPMIVMSQPSSAANNSIKLPFGTSIYDLKVPAMPTASDRGRKSGNARAHST